MTSKVVSCADLGIGKGTQAPNIKDKFCICHLVRFDNQYTNLEQS